MFKFMFQYPGRAFGLTFFQSVALDTLVQEFCVLLPALLFFYYIVFI